MGQFLGNEASGELVGSGVDATPASVVDRECMESGTPGLRSRDSHTGINSSCLRSAFLGDAASPWCNADITSILPDEVSYAAETTVESPAVGFCAAAQAP